MKSFKKSEKGEAFQWLRIDVIKCEENPSNIGPRREHLTVKLYTTYVLS